MNTIALITDKFLPATQTFIYEELTGIKNYNVLVLTKHLQNSEQFPFRNLYASKNPNNAVREFAHVIKLQNAALIHVKFGVNALQYIDLKKLTGLPFVVSFHGYDASNKLKDFSVLTGYRQRLFPAADHIITVSQMLKNNLVRSGCPENKITVLWSGVDTNKFYYKPRKLQENEPVKILSIGRLTEKKGFQYLIEAFARVARKRPNSSLLIVGSGSLEKNLQQQIIQLNLTNKITIRNFIPHSEIPQLMHQHHIFCLPSTTSSTGDQEGIPNVLKEAQATGMPVVSTYHSGIPHLIKDGKNGFLVNEKSVYQLSQKLIDLIDHPEAWDKMGLWGRKYVEINFDKYKQAAKLEELYLKLIKKNKRYKR